MSSALMLGTELLRTIQDHSGPRFSVGSDNERAYVASVLVDAHRRDDKPELERVVRLLLDKVPDAESIITVAKQALARRGAHKLLDEVLERVRATHAT